MLRDTTASWTVDRALRCLATGARDRQQKVPGIVAVIVDDTRVTLHLAAPNGAAPEPWSVSVDSISWSAELTVLQSTWADGSTPHPVSSFVCLGQSESGLVFADLCQARGVIAIDGDWLARREVLRGWIGDYARAPWSRQHPILIVGLPDLVADSTTTFATAGEAIAHASAVRPMPNPRGAPALTGFIALGSAPTRTTARTAFINSISTVRAWPIVTLGPSPDARWTFTAEPDGSLTSDFFPPVRSAETALAIVTARR